MASIVPYGKRWRAHVHAGGRRQSRLFDTRREAAQWAADRERQLEDAAEHAAAGMTFAEAAEEWLKLKLPQLSNAENQRTVEQSVRDYAIPPLGHMRLADIKKSHLTAAVKAVVQEGAVRERIETAHRVGRRIREILDLAVDNGHIEMHAADRLSRVLPRRKKRHIVAIKPDELPALLKAIVGYPEDVTRLGLLLMAHTFLRTSELRGQWSEILKDDDVWVVPGERMKRKDGDGEGIPHVVPLSKQTQAILGHLREINADSPHILASPYDRGATISKNTLLFALYRLGYRGKMTGHGFRAVASSVLNQSKLWHPDAIERQLAHGETNKVREAYNRAEYLAERRLMMAWWSEHLEKLTPSG